MQPVEKPSDNWTEALVRFLRDRPEVNAVRIDPVAHKLAVATIGEVDLALFENQLRGHDRRRGSATGDRLAAENIRRLFNLEGWRVGHFGTRYVCNGGENVALAGDGMARDQSRAFSRKSGMADTFSTRVGVRDIWALAATFAKHFAVNGRGWRKGFFSSQV